MIISVSFQLFSRFDVYTYTPVIGRKRLLHLRETALSFVGGIINSVSRFNELNYCVTEVIVVFGDGKHLTNPKKETIMRTIE